MSAIPPAATNAAMSSGRIAENVYDNQSEAMDIAINMLIESYGS